MSPATKEFQMNKQQVKGMANEATGKVKKEVGKATDDHTLQAKGAARELKGKAQQGVGNVKEDLKDANADADAAAKDTHHRDRDLDR
jgi:uncharacterized protein YjbJ (UPF0337 family)